MLSEYQFDFRSHRSTELAVTYFIDHIRKEADNGNLTGAVFIDLSKAFDTVSHCGLLNKLPNYGIQDKELDWFTDYLFLRRQIVQFSGTLSEPNPVFTGVPQGSLIGPLLSLFTSMIHTKLYKHAKSLLMLMTQWFSHPLMTWTLFKMH